ncbi:pyridoxamine 5'-phosphate oxidase family protein [Marispirochaeta aestuarii]|uniref:pyridoxamine 5'-phosphate oxidase family protein n=1 Tax=Marispirochaeta aestuarii TaxID=1963862 RepID=UPI002ABD2596|nr:pyridoxamine 5'-phosphate oxidase family protein [Marispirochaeta aestuarii]
MRRKDKEITDNSLLDDILSNNTICRVALSDGDTPYVIPMNYGYKDRAFYLHSAPEGRKLDLLQKNRNVCIEVTDSIESVTSKKACGYGTKYRSVICTGIAHFLTDANQKIEGLKIIMKQQTGNSEWEIPEAAVSNVVVLKIITESVTGKISGI